MVQLLGEEKTMDYMVKLNKQIRQYTKSGTAPARMVGNKESLLGVTSYMLHINIMSKVIQIL